MVAGPPRESLPVPPAVLAVAAGRLVHLVWRNELGGLTFEIGSGQERCFCKWSPAMSPIGPDAERLRLEWAGAWGGVPALLSHGRDAAGSWIVTRAMPGENAMAARWKSEPRTAVKAIGRALRAFHDRLPIASCPFSSSPQVQLTDIRRHAAAGRLPRSSWHPSHRSLELSDALARLQDPPPTDVLVVCHGDACTPNTLIDDEGQFSGHVDLGGLGVADRWADLAVATWSTQWNFGPEWVGALLDAYGVAADPERTRYYRLLWDLTF